MRSILTEFCKEIYPNSIKIAPKANTITRVFIAYRPVLAITAFFTSERWVNVDTVIINPERTIRTLPAVSKSGTAKSNTAPTANIIKPDKDKTAPEETIQAMTLLLLLESDSLPLLLLSTLIYLHLLDSNERIVKNNMKDVNTK